MSHECRGVGDRGAASRPGPQHQRPNAGELGSTTLALVLVTPAMLVLIMGGVQLGLWMHLQHVATAAAQEGLVAARVEGGSPTAGEARANRFLTELAPPLLRDRRVSASSVGDDARVEVTGTVAEVIPGVRLRVRAVSQAPRETFRAP